MNDESGRKHVFILPSIFALDYDNNLPIGCSECDFVVNVSHTCERDCPPHKQVWKPLVLKVLPHKMHRS